MAGRCIQVTSMVLAMLASISLGLGVANVIAVYYLVYNVTTTNCAPSLATTATCPFRNIITLAFIGSGIWGSLVVFALAIMAIRSIAKQLQYRTMFMTAMFVTAAVIVPTMIVLNAINAALTTSEYTSPATQPIFNPTSSSNSASSTLLFALPVAVSGVGFMEFLLMSGLIIYTCMYYKEKPVSKEPRVETKVIVPTQPAVVVEPVQVPVPFPVPVPAPAPAFGPGLAYSPYGPLPYRRPLAYGVADYGKADPSSIYRPALRTPYMYPPAAGYRYQMARPTPVSYVRGAA